MLNFLLLRKEYMGLVALRRLTCHFMDCYSEIVAFLQA